MKGSEWGGVQEINARNEELSMSRRAQYILKLYNYKNSQIYGLLKSAIFIPDIRFRSYNSSTSRILVSSPQADLKRIWDGFEAANEKNTVEV